MRENAEQNNSEYGHFLLSINQVFGVAARAVAPTFITYFARSFLNQFVSLEAFIFE